MPFLGMPDLFVLLNLINPNLVAVIMRSAFTSTTGTQYLAQLWQAGGDSNSCQSNSTACNHGGISLSVISHLGDPFLAELPGGYNTGLVRQFIPRFNYCIL